VAGKRREGGVLTLCIYVWPEGVLQSIDSLIRDIKAKNYKIGRKESGDLGAVFVGARSTVVIKESTFVDCSSSQNGSRIYSDMHSYSLRCLASCFKLRQLVLVHMSRIVRVSRGLIESNTNLYHAKGTSMKSLL